MSQQAPIDKIARLLRLAEGEGTNPNEAAVAAATAARLMAEHRLERADVDDAGGIAEEPIEASEQALYAMAKRVPWVCALGAGVARSQGCRTFLRVVKLREGKRTQLALVGRRSDVEATRYLFAYLSREIERLCELARESGRIERGVAASNSFRMGAVEIVIHRLRQARDDVTRDFARSRGDQGARAIVQVDQQEAAVELWMKQRLKLRTSPKSRQGRDAHALLMGRIAGEEIEIRRGIEGHRAPRGLKS